MSRPPDLAVIGNGRIAALVNNQGQLVWWCFPALRQRSGFLPPDRGRRGKGLCRCGAGPAGGQPVFL